MPILSGNAYDVINGDGSWKTSDQVRNVTTKTTTGTLAVTEAGLVSVSATGAYALTLPASSGNIGLTYHVKKTDFNYNTITFAGASTGNLFNYPNNDSEMKTTYPRLNTGGAEATFISDGTNWQVVNEQMGQVPECKVYMSADQADLDGDVWTVVEFDTEDYDIGSNFSTGDYNFTCPVAGKYNITANVITTAASTIADKGYRVRVMKDAGVMGYAFTQASITSQVGVIFSADYSYAASETISIEYYPNVGSTSDTVDLLGSNDITYSNWTIKLIAKD